jgi:hypothetical protein
MPSINKRLADVGRGFAAFLTPPPEGVIRFSVGQPNFRAPDIAVAAAKDALDQGLHGYTRSQGTEELCEQIRYFREACGVRYVFFEPIQDVVSGRSETSKEELLSDLSVRLSKLAAELNVGIITIAHTNDDGDPKYCKMIGQRASVIIDLSRDKEAEDDQERNTTTLKVEKNRPCSEEGYAGSLRFNMDTFTLQELDYG